MRFCDNGHYTQNIENTYSKHGFHEKKTTFSRHLLHAMHLCLHETRRNGAHDEGDYRTQPAAYTEAGDYQHYRLFRDV